MRTTSAVTASLILVTVLSGGWHAAEAQAPPELAGGWIVTSWTAPDGTVNSSPQRGLFVFTATGQYSMMYVPGDEPRPRYPGEDPTDAEMLAAYQSLVANSGRYTVDGNKLTYEAYVAKDPNYMADWDMETRANATNVTFSIANGILTLKWIDGRNAGQTATLRRPNAPQGDQE